MFVTILSQNLPNGTKRDNRVFFSVHGITMIMNAAKLFAVINRVFFKLVVSILVGYSIFLKSVTIFWYAIPFNWLFFLFYLICGPESVISNGYYSNLENVEEKCPKKFRWLKVRSKKKQKFTMVLYPVYANKASLAGAFAPSGLLEICKIFCIKIFHLKTAPPL